MSQPSAIDDHSTLRPEIDQIISSGRQQKTAEGSIRPVAVSGLAAGALLWTAFTPVDFAPLAWIALVPLCLLLRAKQLPKYSYRILWLCGFVWAIATLQWMRLGHPAMYGAVAALSFYLAFYFPAFVAIGPGWSYEPGAPCGWLPQLSGQRWNI